MGISLFKVSKDSYGSYDSPPIGGFSSVKSELTTGDCSTSIGYPAGEAQNSWMKNLPNPDNYEIIASEKINDFLIVHIRYLDCTNYEGAKVLVYKGIDLMDLKFQKYIDPHFSENKKYHSPVARFEPTVRGYDMAVSFAENCK